MMDGMTEREMILVAAARAHARWCAMPHAPRPVPADAPADYGAHDLDYDEPDGEAYHVFYEEELAKLASGQA